MAGTSSSGRRPRHPKMKMVAFAVPATHLALVREAAKARGASLAAIERDVFWAGVMARRIVARAVDALREVATEEGLEAEGQLLVLTEPRRRRAALADTLFSFYVDVALGRDPAAWKLEVEVANANDRAEWTKEFASGVAARRIEAEKLLQEDLGRTMPARTLAEALAGVDPLDAELDEELDAAAAPRPAMSNREAELEAQLAAAELEAADLRTELRRRHEAFQDALVEAARVAEDDAVGQSVLEALERALPTRLKVR